MIINNNSTRINIQSWFIPFDIFMIMCTVLVVILAMSFLIIIVLDKTCRTVPMMHVANSCLAELIFGSSMLGMAIFTLENDLKQIQYQDSFCVFRGFMGYAMAVSQNYSYLLQAIFRYNTVVHPTRLFFRSARFQALLIFLTWTFSFVCSVPYVVNDEIKYNVDNQICQMPLHFSFLAIYNALCVYMIPISLTMLIYFKLVRYVRKISRNIAPINTLYHAQRELKMVRRIVILIMSVATIGLPYGIFVLISFCISPPIYHFRIAYIFVDASLAFVIIALFEFTEPLKASIMKQINKQVNMIGYEMT